jgi:hypothetical protein
MFRAALLTLIAAVTLSAAPPANAALINFVVDLAGENEFPMPVDTTGEGTAEVVINTVTMTMTLDVEFMNLLGNTAAAHIHCCVLVPPNNAMVATQVPSFVDFPLGVTSGTYLRTFDMTLASSYNPAFLTANSLATPEDAFAFLLAGMLAGQSYLNIHTNLFPGGEIRGTLIQVPEPASLGLLALAIAGLAMAPGRRKPR